MLVQVIADVHRAIEGITDQVASIDRLLIFHQFRGGCLGGLRLDDLLDWRRFRLLLLLDRLGDGWRFVGSRQGLIIVVVDTINDAQ